MTGELARERELLARLAEAERLLAAVPDLERELGETIRERNAAIMELEQGSAPRQHTELLELVARQEAEIALLRNRIRAMESTRAWRLGTRYWTMRGGIASLVRREPKERPHP
jgi:hypothetical protein